MAKGFPGGKSRLRESHTKNFHEGSRETRKSRRRSSEMAVNGVRDKDKPNEASNFVV